MKMFKLFFISALFAGAYPSFAQNLQSTTIYLSAEENQFYQLINQFRSRLGLPTLQIHAFLQNASKGHSEWMQKQDFLTHYGPTINYTPYQRMKDAGYVNYTYAGENIACGNADALSTFKQWAFSEGHLQNMMNNNFTQMGISRTGNGTERCPYYWVNDFGSFSPIAPAPENISNQKTVNQAIGTILGISEDAVSNGRAIYSSTVQRSNVPAPTATAPSVHSLQCYVPSSLGKGALTTWAGTDTLVTITSADEGKTFQGKLTYIQNGEASSLYPVVLSSLSLVQNAEFPILTLFVAPAYRVSGFTIQVNTKSNKAQFDIFPNTGSSALIECTMKY